MNFCSFENGSHWNFIPYIIEPQGFVLTLFVGEKKIKWHGTYAERDRSSGCWLLFGGKGVVVDGNVELVFKKSDGGKRLGYTWLNTSLIGEREVLVLTKAEVDKFHKDRKHKKYSQDLKITLEFGEMLETNPMLGGERKTC